MTTDRRYVHDFVERSHAKHYRRRCHVGGDADKFLGLKDINQSIKVSMVDIYNNDLFEIYTCNPEPITEGVYSGSPAGAVDGWEIKWILAPNKETIKQYPFFDCIISINDNSTGQATDAELFTV